MSYKDLFKTSAAQGPQKPANPKEPVEKPVGDPPAKKEHNPKS